MNGPGPIAGVDEVGRGPLAGPVVAAAVILGADIPVGLADSKKLTAKRRVQLAEHIHASCRVGIGMASVAEIDTLNILYATLLAMERAVETLGVAPELVLVDGNRCPGWRWPSRAIIGGDASEACISAASIIAKVYRDALMADLHHQYPQFGWDRNAGYGVPHHLAALAEHGPSPHHRRSFAPVARFFAKTGG